MLDRVEFSVNDFAEDLILIKCPSDALNQNPLIFWQLSKTLLVSLTDIEVIAGEDSLAVKVNILKKTRLQHLTELKNFLGTYQPEFKEESSELITVPICYDNEFALDMSDISLAKGLSKEEVIDALMKGEPRVAVAPSENGNALLLNPMTVIDGESEIVLERLLQVLG